MAKKSLRQNKAVKKKVLKSNVPNSSKASKPSSNIKLYIVILAVIVCGIVLAFAYMINIRYQSVLKLDNTVIVDNGAKAINNTNLSLNFGTNNPGGIGYRWFNIESDYKSNIRIVVTGEMSKFLTFEDNNFIMQPYENRTIKTILTIPPGTPLGAYDGKVVVYFLKP